MRKDTTGSTTRRTFVKYGLLSTGALVGTSSAGATGESVTEPPRPVERGVMRSYQHAANSPVTVLETLDWQPRGLEDAAGYAVAYDAAPSYQALLFTPGAGSDDSDSGPLRPGDSLSLGGVRGSPAETSRRYVTVGLETEE